MRLIPTSQRSHVLALLAAHAVMAVALFRLAGDAPKPTTFLCLAIVLTSLLVGGVGVSGSDATAVLTLMLVLLFLLPENYVLVGPLKSVGNPALLAGLAALVLWIAGRVLGMIVPRPSHPVRWVLLAFVLTTLTAYGAAGTRPLTDIESSGVTRAVFPLLAMLGIALLACDAITERKRLETLLRRLVVIGGLAALAGITQFTFPGFNYKELTRLPGLTSNTEIINGIRSGFDRIDGAAAHPIEYAVALAALAPLALHYALNAESRTSRRLCGASLVAILIVNPLTVSRSGLLALVVGLGFYFVELGPRARFNGLVLGLIGLGLFRTAVPGLIGTLKGLIFIGEADPSIAGRTEDYAKIPGLMNGHTWFGRGLGTFQPFQYFYLDNQYLGSLLEGGVVALVVLIVIGVSGVCLARGVRKRAQDVSTHRLGQALAGSFAALVASAATYDELSFHQTGFLFFLLLGCIGCLWSMMRESEAAKATAPPVAAVEPRAVAPAWRG